MTQTASERIHALVTPDALQLPVNTQAPIRLVVTNRGPVVDQLDVQVEGVDPSWITFETRTVNLLPEASGTLGLQVHVPDEARAGTYTLRITVGSREDARQAVELSLPLEVLAYGALGLELVPAVASTRWRSARYALRLANTGNEARLIDLVATDPDEALNLKLDLDRVSLDPGETTVVGLSARARKRPLIAPPRTLPFSVSAVSATELSEPLAGAQGRLTYTAPLVFLAMLPLQGRRLLLAALALLIALAALIWLLGQSGTHIGVPEAQPTATPPALPTVAPQPAAAAPPAPAAPPAAPPAPAPTAPPAPTATAVPLPTIGRFELVMPTDPQTQPTLVWNVSGADSVTINGETRPTSGSEPIQQLTNSQYELAATNGGGTVKKAVGILVLAPPKIDDFSASATQIQAGQSVSLHWKAHGGQHATLLGQSVDPNEGTGEIQLNDSTTLTLVVDNELGRDTRTVDVTVGATPTPQP